MASKKYGNKSARIDEIEYHFDLDCAFRDDDVCDKKRGAVEGLSMIERSSSVRRPQHKFFNFTRSQIEGRRLYFEYSLSGGPDPDIGFREEIRLPDNLPPLDPDDPVIRRLVDGCHRVFGVSYFKAAVATYVQAAPVDEADAAFWDSLYSIGMGEFYFRNGLDPQNRVSFPRQIGALPQAPGNAVRPTERALVLIGGGKDSAVVSEVVRQSGIKADALALGASPWISASAAAGGLQLMNIYRKLDPALIELNRHGAWNGHVPISACIAFIAVLAGYVGGYTDIIAGNERSADEGNVEWNGLVINHQWSKSLDFERAFQFWCARNVPSTPRYFSLLRPLGEVAIAVALARHPAHFDSFTSCNANFRQTHSTVPERWCGHCPKCIFVELMLSPHLNDNGLRRIFPHSFLAQANNIPLLEQLLGVIGSKPWECVGTPLECRLSLALLHQQGRLKGAAAEWLRDHQELLLSDAESVLRSMLEPSGPHTLTPSWWERLDAYLRFGE
jgi:hypothetical protein